MTHEGGTDAGRRSRIEPILDRLLDAEDGTARATVLAEVRRSDPALASHVATAYEALLKNEDLLARPLSEVVPDLLADFSRRKPTGPDESESSRCGRILGSYRLIEVLDRGGMGVVYVAERADEQFEMRVAVKLLPRGLESPEAERRFLTERQILADLEHPHIARLLDGGLTEEGYPYLVMELVDGQPIDEYCRHHDLDLEGRLRLFLQVLNAVQHAHQHMVIHRDLKPSNILVTADGTVKLLDFGIAKLADPSAEAQGASTLFQPRSIRYASPEQVANRPVSAASDVYSLGVVLYQLVTGVVPLELDPLSPGERERVVREVLPEPPSARSRRWRRRLRGDLDNIVLEALRKDPARRYPTAAHLAADIERYLRDEPVSARKRTWSYSTRKFLSRHRVGALLATGVLALLLVFVSTVIRQEKRALAEARKAERVAELLAELFEGANPFSAEVGTRDLKSVLDRAEARIRDQLADEPEIRAELLEVIGRAYGGLGLFSQSAVLHEEALEIRRALFGPEDLRVAESSLSLGTALESRGHYEKAQSLYQRALAIFESRTGEDSPEVGSVLTRLGRLIAHRGDPVVGVEGR